MAATKSDHVRRLLAGNLHRSFKDIQKVLASLDMTVTPGLVYTIRSQMKRDAMATTDEAKPKSLRDYLLDLLVQNDKLPFDQLTMGVLNLGYQTKSETFPDHVRKKLRFMLESGEIVRDGDDLYQLANGVAKPRVVVKSQPIQEPPTFDGVPPHQEDSNQIREGSNPEDSNPTMEALLEVARVCKKIGGIKEIRRYLAVLEQISL